MDAKYRDIAKIETDLLFREIKDYIKEQSNKEAPAPELQRLKSLCFDYETEFNYKPKYKSAGVLVPAYAIHPAETIRDEMEARGETQKELAEKMGVSKRYINELLNCKKDITPTIAIKLESVWGIPAEFWVRMQTQYEIHKIQIKAKQQMKKLTSTRKQRNSKAKKETATA